MPRRRGPAAILDFDEGGVAARLQGQKLKVAGLPVCRQIAPKDVGEMEWDLASGSLGVLEGFPPSASGG